MTFPCKTSRALHHFPVGRTLLIAAVVVVALIAHLGIGGAALSGSWTGPAIAVALVAVIGKVSLITLGHRRIRLRRAAAKETSGRG